MIEFYKVKKFNQINLDKDIEDTVHKLIKSKIKPRNVATYYSFCKLYNLKDLSDLTLNYIQLWFTTVAETNNFLEMGFPMIKRIILSSNLNVTSEIEVFTAANAWVSCRFDERTKHAKDLLLSVRLPLLTKPALVKVLKDSSSFHKIDECLALIKEMLENKKQCYKRLPSSCFTTRYYKANSFDVLHCGDHFSSVDSEADINTSFVDKIDGRNLIKCRKAKSLTKNRVFSRDYTPMVCLKGHVYLLGCSHDEGKNLKKIEKYSVETDALEVVGDMIGDRESFCVCGFVDKIYFIGSETLDEPTATCRYFCTNDYTWGSIVDMNEARSSAACTVFEERIVVTGGWGNYSILKTVEAFDYIANEWTYMPSMIERAFDHALVAIKNKLFAIGARKTFLEVYDSASNAFVSIKNQIRRYPAHNFSEYAWFTHAMGMAGKVFIFSLESSEVRCYDSDRGEWSNLPCSTATDGCNFFTKIPKLEL